MKSKSFEVQGRAFNRQLNRRQRVVLPTVGRWTVCGSSVTRCAKSTTALFMPSTSSVFGAVEETLPPCLQVSNECLGGHAGGRVQSSPGPRTPSTVFTSAMDRGRLMNGRARHKVRKPRWRKYVSKERTEERQTREGDGLCRGDD
jgi:hypothetical protein